MRIEEIKDRIRRMLQERASGDPNADTSTAPSEYWSAFCSWSSYVMDLSEASLRQLRLHTYHLTADNYQSYFFRSNAERWRENSGYDRLIDGLPARHTIAEPEGGIGLHFPRDGRFLSSDIVRFQRVIRTLSRAGVLERVEHASGAERPVVMELGGGYGGLAYHVLPMLGRSIYVIVDLPETLFFSAVYLNQHATDRRMYLYSADDYDVALQSKFRDYDYVLLPNWRVQDLASFRFDLVLNVESLQEMTTAQVTEYLDFIAATCTGTFYSFNMDRNHRNLELTSLNGLLRSRFAVETVPTPPQPPRARLIAFLRAAATRAGLLDASYTDVDTSYHELLCRPKGTLGRAGAGA